MRDERVSVVGASGDRAIRGTQAQALLPCITSATSGSSRLSAGIVVMPPRASSKVHVHEHSDIVVMVVAGKALTLVGDDLIPYAHAPGEFIFIPAGVIHMAVNLSSSSPLTAVEVRTDPHFRGHFRTRSTCLL
ncbi:cupin domain-containing protein [Pseudonocardia sp. ICBG1293]|uniref:cupin domain-containing protein n=1 Tax=Pseudonocardia sp. ICBG1293 TaxID=2844382 RepID=UPI001CCB6371